MISEEKKKVLDLFKQGRQKYKLMFFKEAKELFAEALKVDPSDGPSGEFFRRCDAYIANPPSEDWDGVYEMSTK